MNKYLIIGLILISQVGFSQIKELNPTSVSTLDLSSEGEQEFNANLEASKKIEDKMSNGVKYDDLSQEEKDVLSKVDETKEDYWDIIGGGCSWYCGGGPKEVAASSYLKPQGINNYEPKNAHDLNYKSVWADGVDGYGIGEFLLYTFEGASPRINEILVVNGYIKSQSAWENNSRVKKLKMYIDNKPYAILNLKDIRGTQSFKVEPIGNSDRKDWDKLQTKPDWTIKFEILEVYKGLKYDDVVISEIYFDGLDVHCFAKGTKVQIDKKSAKNIEDLKIGDFVLTFDFTSKKTIPAKIEKLDSVFHHNLVTYIFKSGLKITSTQDHPFLILNKGWSSLNPIQSGQYKGFEKINKIAVGDHFQTSINYDQLTYDELLKIEFLNDTQITYTICKLSNGNNFIANGFIVGVEEDNGKTVGNPL